MLPYAQYKGRSGQFLFAWGPLRPPPGTPTARVNWHSHRGPRGKPPLRRGQLKQGTKIFCQFCGKKYPNLQPNSTPSQASQPVQQSAPPSPKGGNPKGQGKGKGKGKGKGPAPPQPAAEDQPSQGFPLKGVLKTLHTNWGALASTTKDELVKAGFKPPPPPTEDPLLLALKANKEGLPQEVREALEASEATPEPTQEERCVTSANVLSRAGARLKSLTKRRIDLQATITTTKETLRLQLEELQDVIKKLAQAQEEVEKSSKLTRATWTRRRGFPSQERLIRKMKTWPQWSHRTSSTLQERGTRISPRTGRRRPERGRGRPESEAMGKGVARAVGVICPPWRPSTSCRATVLPLPMRV